MSDPDDSLNELALGELAREVILLRAENERLKAEKERLNSVIEELCRRIVGEKEDNGKREAYLRLAQGLL